MPWVRRIRGARPFILDGLEAGMPFVCCLAPDEPFEITFLTGNRETIIRIPIGYDPEAEVTYSLVTALAPLAGSAEGEFEQAFHIAESDALGSQTHDFFDGLQTRGFLDDKAHRALVLDALLTATSLLIEHASPHIVTFMTYEDNLPPKALAKYHAVAAVYRQAGYRAGAADP